MNVQQEGESLSAFIESSVRESVERRRVCAEFLARGLASREAVQRGGVTVSAKAVHADLARRLAKAKKRVDA